MKQEQFEALVEKAESLAQRSPIQYQMRLIVFTLLGYGYVLLLLGVLIASLLLMVFAIANGHGAWVLSFFLKGGFFLLIPLGFTAKPLWRVLTSRGVPDEGVALKRADYPVLYKMLDTLSLVLKSPRVDEVRITDQFNACMLQQPLFGLFGPSKNYLSLGFPLMTILSPPHFQAVVAHEMGHLSSQHSRWSSLIYSASVLWEQIDDALEHEDDWLFKPFYKWYAPRFSAYTFVMCRQQEYEADALSTRICGADVAGASLVDVHVYGAVIDALFWSDLCRVNQDALPCDPMDRLQAWWHARGQEDPQAFQAQLAATLDKALQRQTNYVDLHPCLSDRLLALGCRLDEVQCSLPGGESAVSLYLKEAEQTRIKKLLNLEWFDRHVDRWLAEKDRKEAQQAEIMHLRAELSNGQHDLEWKDMLKVAMWHANQGDLAQAKSILEGLAPEHLPARFFHAVLQLDHDDPQGLEAMYQLIDEDMLYYQQAYPSVMDYCQRNGLTQEEERFRAYFDVLRRRRDLWKFQLSEAIFIKGQVAPHVLTQESLERLQKILATCPSVERAYCVRCVLEETSESILHALVICARLPWYQRLWSRRMVVVEAQVEACLQQEDEEQLQDFRVALLMALDEKRRTGKTMLGFIAKVPRAQVYPASEAAQAETHPVRTIATARASESSLSKVSEA